VIAERSRENCGGVLWLIVVYCFLNFRYVLDGVPRMRERPIGDLVVGLKQLGADVDCFLGTDCPPVRVKGIGGLPGGKVS
jgi:5-enolpyruvylshikimate-3-phosphate synthase